DTKIQQIAADYGSSSLQDVFEYRRAELLRLSSQLDAMELQLAQSGVRVGPTTGPTTNAATAIAPVVDARQMIFNDMLKHDAVLHDLQRQQRELDRQIAVSIRRYGPNHPEVRD